VYLRSLHISHVRNLVEQSIDFSPGFNYLFGANGAGKTAVLETIHLLARGRSFRTQKVASVISRGEQHLIVRGEVLADRGETNRLAIAKSRSGATELRLNGVTQSRASALAKHLPVQTLLPQAPELVLGGPSERRGFLDWGVFHVEHRFVDAARSYRRVLAQRNAWLKTQAMNAAGIGQDPWIAQLLQYGVNVSEMRAKYTEAFAPLFRKNLQALSRGLDVVVNYDWGGLESPSEAEKKMSESWPRDVKFGLTHRGPHRADLQFGIDDQPVAEVVSRGQAKLISSAAILAQAQLLYEQTNAKSLILIDDFGAELDADHWRQFVATLLSMQCQVIATSTEALDTSQAWVDDLDALRVFHVKHGRIERRSV